MKNKGFQKEVINWQEASKDLVVPKKTAYLLFFVVIILTVFVTYFVVVSTQASKIIKEGFPVSENSGEVKLYIKPQPAKSASDGTVNLNILAAGG